MPDNNTIAVAASAVALLSAVAAWAALIVQRWNATDTIEAQVNIGARTSRAAVVSANRQRWIDAVRDDVSDFIATRSHLALVAKAGSFEQAGQDAIMREERELRAKLLRLRSRIELRINRTEPEHLNLLKALDRYDREFSDESDNDLRVQAGAIFKSEWERLKKEAAGTNPFVKEVKHRRPK